MKVGLTGGIGSGKSAVARLLVEHGALVVDADAVAREVVAPGSAGLAQIADRWVSKYAQPFTRAMLDLKSAAESTAAKEQP